MAPGRLELALDYELKSSQVSTLHLTPRPSQAKLRAPGSRVVRAAAKGAVDELALYGGGKVS